jgi:hypothetical protein
VSETGRYRAPSAPDPAAGAEGMVAVRRVIRPEARPFPKEEVATAGPIFAPGGERRLDYWMRKVVFL